MSDRGLGRRVELETVFFEPAAEGVVLLTLNRPDHANGVVPELARDVLDALVRLERDRSVRAVVVTGAGPHFCAGADLKAVKRYLDERHAVENEPFNARVVFPVTAKVASCRMPVIAAINGGATAGGLDLALACDMRIASTSAKLGETYITIGMMPGNGGTYFMPRLIGSGMAAELSLTGDVIDADRALAIGLVNRVVAPELLIETAVELAERIARHPWRALEATKQALRSSWQMDLQSVFNTSYWAVAALAYGADFREGVDALLEGRVAEFGRSEPETMHWDVGNRPDAEPA